MKQIWVTQKNWPTFNTLIPNDGQDYEIIFDPGVFDISLLSASDIVINHSAGGVLNFHPHTAGQTTLFLPTPSLIFYRIFVIGTSISFGGFNMIGQPYYELATVSAPTFIVCIGASQNAYPTLCEPTYLCFHDISTTGRQFTFLTVASDSDSVYTNIVYRDISILDNDSNGFLTVRGVTSTFPPPWGEGARCHVYFDNIYSYSRNGPDGPLYGGVSSSSHRNGTAALGTGIIGGYSTITATRCNITSHILGSLNHDHHCFQFVNDNGWLTYKMIDCQFNGYWESGHTTGEGGGNMWLGYYHAGGPARTTPGDRPHYEFQNCLFKHKIEPGVLESAASVKAAAGTIPLFDCGSDADYVLYDCQLLYDAPASFTSIAHDFFFNASSMTFTQNNTPGSGAFYGMSGGGGTIGPDQHLIVTPNTLSGPGIGYGRIPTLPSS